MCHFASVGVAGIDGAGVAVVDGDGCKDAVSLNAGILGAGVVVIAFDGNIAAAGLGIAGIGGAGILVVAGGVVDDIAATIGRVTCIDGAFHLVVAVEGCPALAFTIDASFANGADSVVVALSIVVHEEATVGGITGVVGAGVLVVAKQGFAFGTFALSTELDAVTDVAVVTADGCSGASSVAVANVVEGAGIIIIAFGICRRRR